MNLITKKVIILLMRQLIKYFGFVATRRRFDFQEKAVVLPCDARLKQNILCEHLFVKLIMLG